jgi:protein ImuB
MHLPLWPLQRLWHDRHELRGRPLALCEQAAGSSRIVLYFNPERKRSCRVNGPAGVHPGMPVAEALAIEPSLHVQEYDAEADVGALGELAEWAGRFSPIVALEARERRHSLLLDITGCAACFGGEQRMLERAVQEVRDQGWNARVAIADTVGAAWGLAHYGGTPIRANPGQAEGVLLPLPVAALRLPDEVVGCLAELGIERIGELMALPRSSLPARLGPLVLERLDQLRGRLPEVLVPHRPLPPVEVTCSFEYATDQRDALDYALNQLIDHVCHILDERHAGARQIECVLHHEVAKPLCLEVEMVRASRSAKHMRMLFRARFERVTLDEPVCAMSLRVPVTVRLDASQCEIFDADAAQDAGELSKLVDELSNRLGREAVTRVRLVADAQPEYACRYEPAVHGVSRSRVAREMTEPDVFWPVRPLRLWADPICIPTTSVVPEGPPMRFHWDGVEHSIARSWGPERIETGWWRHEDVHRDYYLVETLTGARFWIYRRRDDDNWFLHGCFD